MKYISILLFLISPVFMVAQTNIDIDFDTNIEINSHPFSIQTVSSDMISSWSLSARQSINENSRWVASIYYNEFLNQDVYDNGGLSLMLQFKGLNTNGIKTYSGIKYQSVFLSDSLKNNEGSILSAYANMRKDLSLSSFIKTGVDGKFSYYSEIPEFTNSTLEYWLGYHKSFQTKSSLQTYLELGYQNFAQIIENGGGRGRYYVSEVSDIPSRQIMSISGQFSQNLGRYVGGIIRAEKQWRWTSSDDAYGTILVGDNPFLDNYEWEGESYSLKFNIRLPHSFRITPWISYNSLSFPDRNIYEYNFATESYSIVDDSPVILGVGRESDSKSIGVRLAKNMELGTINRNLSLRLFSSLNYTIQESNDVLYDYEGRKVELGISITP